MASIKKIPSDLGMVSLKERVAGYGIRANFGIRYGWMLVEDVALEGEPSLILDNFFRRGDSRVAAYKMIERAKEEAGEKGACAGLLHAERMLEQDAEIPVEWQDFNLLFTGTVWQYEDGRYVTPCLCHWRYGGWNLCFHCLDVRYYTPGVNNYYRLVRLGK